ncbi:MAG TPA: condensation domain-containing protein [Nitrosospira sp.]|nr:condensation domain-containing protein [Nitrosospira sp.]
MSRKGIEAIYALSPQQLGMLFESLYTTGTTSATNTTGSGMHIEQKTFAFDDNWNMAAWRESWQHVVDWHPALRTAFVWRNQKEPLQAVMSYADIPFEQHDLGALDESARQERLATILREDRERGFVLTQAPLMRLMAIRMSDKSWVAVWAHHHILLDGWSLSIISRDVCNFYNARCRRLEWNPEPSRPYRDYIDWLARRDTREAETFWRGRLDGFFRPTPVGQPENAESGNDRVGKIAPAALAAQGESTERYSYRECRLPRNLLTALQSAGFAHGLTLNTLLQGAWAILLSRYSGQRDIVYGTTVSGRPPELAGVERMVGLFITTLPLRLKIEPAKPLAIWLDQVQAEHLAMRQFEYCSAGQIHQWSEVPGTLPLYESVLVFENYPMDDTVRPTANRENDFVGAQTRHALTLLVSAEEELVVRIIYDMRRFHGEATAHMIEHLWSVLAGMAENLQQPADTLADLIPREQIPAVRPPPRKGARILPQTPTEGVLAQIWSELLGLEEVGVTDNFFEYGGHSLLAIQLVSRVRSTFQLDLPLHSFFDAPTVRDLAALIEAQLLDELAQLSEEEARRAMGGIEERTGAR